jgi:hypothetical protein
MELGAPFRVENPRGAHGMFERIKSAQSSPSLNELLGAALGQGRKTLCLILAAPQK